MHIHTCVCVYVCLCIYGYDIDPKLNCSMLIPWSFFSSLTLFRFYSFVNTVNMTKRYGNHWVNIAYRDDFDQKIHLINQVHYLHQQIEMFCKVLILFHSGVKSGQTPNS